MNTLSNIFLRFLFVLFSVWWSIFFSFSWRLLATSRPSQYSRMFFEFMASWRLHWAGK